MSNLFLSEEKISYLIKFDENEFLKRNFYNNVVNYVSLNNNEIRSSLEKCIPKQTKILWTEVWLENRGQNGQGTWFINNVYLHH